ncbi:hypothetical protein J3R83DRAFT_8173, partial [Lanmaoa asiatica]
AMLIVIEQLFSQGCLILFHVHSQLLTQSTQALVCLRSWSLLNLVKADDLKAAAELPDIDEELGLEDGWDRITL